MERGEEEAVRAAVLHLSAAISADVQARSFRRADAENCRPAIFDARATLREQSGSTLGRRERQPRALSPFARNRGMSPLVANLLALDLCTHFERQQVLGPIDVQLGAGHREAQ